MKYLVCFCCIIVMVFGASVRHMTYNNETATKEYNYFASLQFINENGDKEEIGGGTVLNDRWILTAAHILDNVNETKLEVMIENYAIENQTAEVDLSYVKVLKIHKHPKWISSLRGNPLPAQYNIALIELQEPIQFMEGFKLVRIQRTRDEIPEQHEPFTLPEDMGFMQMPLSISASLDIEKFSKDNETCKIYQLDEQAKKTKNICGFYCKGFSIGTSVFEREFMRKSNYVKDTVFGVLTLEILPCNEGPLKIYTEITPYVEEFIIPKIGFGNFEPEFIPSN